MNITPADDTVLIITIILVISLLALVECGVFALFKFKQKRHLITVFLVNFVITPVYVVLYYWFDSNFDIHPHVEPAIIIIGTLGFFFIETIALKICMKEPWTRIVGPAFIANIAAAVISPVLAFSVSFFEIFIAGMLT